MSDYVEDGRRHPGNLLKWLAVASIVILIGFAGGYGFSVLTVHASRFLLPGNAVPVPKPLAQLPGLSAPVAEPTSRITILVMGVDRRPGRPDKYKPQAPWGVTDPGRSDTMALVSIDPATKTVAVLSIPRDLWLEEPDGHGGWSMDRINEPYHTGEINKLPGGGGALAAQAITYNFGIPVDYYVDFDFDGFMSLIDALGGVDINVPNLLTATVYPSADTGAYDYTFYPGMQHLDGELALAYSRFRLDAEGDFGRITRQQAIGLAARQKALTLGWIDHPLDIWQKYNATVESNVPTYMLPGLALLAKQITPDAITVRSLGETGAVQAAVIPESGAEVLHPVPEAIGRIISDAFRDPSLGAAAATRLEREYPTASAPTAANR